MQRIVFLINELETRLSTDDDDEEEDSGKLHKTRDLDSALGLHNEAVRYGQSMRQCRHCLTRAEKRMLLLLLTNRLVVLCTYMVSASCDSVHAGDEADAHLGEPAITITVGEYEIDSPVEGRAVLRELVAFQLRGLHSFIAPLATINEPQGSEFEAARKKVAALLQRLQRSSLVLPPPETPPILQHKS